MSNLKQAIINRNKRLLQDQNKDKFASDKTCNCRNREECPLDGKCLPECTVYKATVTQTESSNKETYIGLPKIHLKQYINYTIFKIQEKLSVQTFYSPVYWGWSLYIKEKTWLIIIHYQFNSSYSSLSTLSSPDALEAWQRDELKFTVSGTHVCPKILIMSSYFAFFLMADNP